MSERWIAWYLGYDDSLQKGDLDMDEYWNDVLTLGTIEALFNPGEGYEVTAEGEPVDLMHAFHLEDD
jgi:hypothetical protein